MVLRVTTAGFLRNDTTVTAWETKLTQVNASVLPIYNCDSVTLILDVLVFIIALVGLAGNAIVLWLLGFCMKRSIFSVYILNLAGADFLFFCCQITWFLYIFIQNCFYSTFLLNFIITVSVFAYIPGLSFLSAISTERCLSVLWPIWYRCHHPRHMAAVICFILWALSLLLNILDMNYCGYLMTNRDQPWCRAFDFIIVAWLVLLFVFLSASSLTLLTKLLCGSQRVQPTRLYVTVLLTVLVFLLCGLPFGIFWFLLPWFLKDFGVLLHLYLIVSLLTCVNSCANPFIYFFVGSFRQRWWRRRQTLRLVLQRALQDTPEVDEQGGNLPQETLEMSGSM